MQEGCHEGPPTRCGGEDITWPDQVAPGAERRLVPATSSLKPQTSLPHVVGEFLGGYSASSESKHTVVRDGRVYTHVCVYVCESMYGYIFSRVPHEWTWISTTPEGSSFPTANQTGWDRDVAFCIRGLCVDLGFHNTHEPLSP